jgi:glycosyltransferase involved in cell wall biosynthesis
MKIVLFLPSFAGGGAERVGVNLANYYSSQGWDTTIVALRPEGPNAQRVSDSVKIINLKIRSRYVAILPELLFAINFSKLFTAIKRLNPDIIISVIRGCNILVGLTYYFLRPTGKIIFREASTLDGIIHESSWVKKKMWLLRMRLAYHRAHKVVANSNDTRDDLVKFKIVNPEKIDTIGNPVLPDDIYSLQKSSVYHRWIGNSQYKIVLNVGRLQKVKNQSLLIQSFLEVYKSNQHARLLILGEGKEKDRLIDLAEHLGLRDVVEILPFQQNPYPFYQAADIFVLSSEWEGFGNVIVEAMASGTPVISTDCHGGPKMILEGGQYGCLVPPNNSQALAEAIIHELNHPTDLEQIEKARKRALEFSVSVIAKKYLAD